MTTVYADYTHGNDTTGTGISSLPYQTFGKAYSVTVAGDTVDLSGYFPWASDPLVSANGIDLDHNITVQGS